VEVDVYVLLGTFPSLQST